MIYFLFRLLDLLVPRFITEDVVYFNGDDEGGEYYEFQFPLALVMPGERFDGIALVRSFTWLGFAFFTKIIEQRPFINPHSSFSVKIK